MTQIWNIIENADFEAVLATFGWFGWKRDFSRKFFFAHFQAFVMLELLAKKIDKTNDSILKYYRKSPFLTCFYPN